jgi:hypothetical protein
MCLQVETMPSAYITVNKGRKKIKRDKYVYLNNGQEFEIELFNPTTDNLLTKIWINNKLMSSSGIVLRPGERVFLERYIDIPKKFLFDTYEVNGDSSAVQKAIEKNGLIKVQFFREDTTVYTPTVTLGNSSTWSGDMFRLDSTNINDTSTYTLTGTDNLTRGISGTFETNGLSDNTLSFASTSSIGGSEVKASFSAPNPMKKRLKKSKKTETGRVEQGSHSQQTFEYTNKKFHSYAFRTVEYQIKPTSTMIQEARTLVTKYCTGCGKKAKPRHKFCSNCGTKL